MYRNELYTKDNTHRHLLRTEQPKVKKTKNRLMDSDHRRLKEADQVYVVCPPTRRLAIL